MKRLLALSCLCLSALACNQSSTTTAVSIPGPNSLAVAGRTLLIASTSDDELRALDLSVDPRSFVRAPNPLFPLSIPTAPFPRAVAAYTFVGTDGIAKTAPFAFALSTAAAQVNVVATYYPDSIKKETLATIGTVVVPDTALAIAVTRPQDPTQPVIDWGAERLVIGVSQGENGSLWTATFPAQIAQADIPTTQPELKVLLGVSIPQTLAASPTLSNIVAVGDRLTEPDGFGRSGGLAVCNLDTGTVVRLDVGGPVMALAFDQTGNRLFGLLDAEACGSEHPCNGMFRVDMTDPMAPKLAGFIDVPSTARGLTAGGAIVVTLASGAAVTIDPLVMVSATDGSLYAYDGARMVPASDPAVQATASILAFRKFDPLGNETTNPTDGPQIYQNDNAESGVVAVLDSSVVRTETLTLTWEGALARGRAGRIVNEGLEDPAFDFAAMGVQPGDLVLFGAESLGTCTSNQATVDSVSGGRIVFSNFVTGCLVATDVVYTVRARQAYVGIGSRSGFQGRAPLVGSFSVAGVSFDIPVRYEQGNPTNQFVPPRDTRYVLSLTSGVPSFALPLGTSLMVPGAMAYDPVRKLFYAAYPGGNAIVEVKPTDMRSGDTTSGLVAYH
ncbi:MAG: hypothetical protein QM765_05835 [Myxococcales bacterium]